MNPLVCSWSRVALSIVAILLAWGTATVALAQTTTCPVAAACKPGSASSPQAAAFGMGIFNVTVGNSIINKT